MIRITGGEFRSRLLETPDTELTKPTMDKVRAAIFSALTNACLENVLDLFAGSGSYGFEAISRGAKSATFVDISPKSTAIIKKNTANLKLNCCDIIQSDSIKFLENCDKKFDCIFVDPPYKLEVYSNVVELINKRNLLSDSGIIVLESDKELTIDFSSFKKVKQYKYGLTKVYILRK